MYQKDYILRMIEMISKLIAGILGLIKGGKLQEASDEIQEAFRNYLKEDAAFFQVIPKDQLTHKLLYEHNYTSGHLEVLSQLFYAQAELDYAQKNYAASLDYYERTIILAEFVLKESKAYSEEKLANISRIKERIKELKSL
jgi:hypothetical protein